MPLAETAEITLEELQLAARNHGLPLEALCYPITPVGLHYLLVHYDVPVVDEATWRLQIGGRVERSLSLSLDDVRARPAVEAAVTLECAGNGRARLTPRPISQPWLSEAVATARWRGTRLAPLLEEVGLAPEAVEIVFSGLDRGIEGGEEQRYRRSLGLHDALMPDVLLAYEMNGRPLPPQHGFPLRLLVPGWYGMASVKWLADIEVVDQPFHGYQMVTSYRFREEEDEEGEPVTRMQPRALLAPPGIPDFFTRERTVPLGRVELEGRAWSGWAPIAGVQVSADGGSTWWDAELVRDLDSRWAWVGWRATWQPRVPGAYELCCRARDEAGNEQPLETRWNLGGYANNGVQRVPVNVV
ncbi:MAG: sulfite oxidase [Thermoleophilia bacterium]|nr:sulfite oxidase [Thermoleophilia bacterium]